MSKEWFAKVRDESIDYAVMEHHNGGKVVPYDGTWNDIGSFQALHGFLPKDSNDNVVNTDIVTLDTKGCFIKSNKLVTTIGLENLALIDTPDVLFIGDIKRSQEVKHIVNKLKQTRKPFFLKGTTSNTFCFQHVVFH